MNLAPIVLFVYNRPWHTRQTLEALKLNELAADSILYIYSDGPKKDASKEDLSKIEEVRRLLREENWCGKVQVVERKENLGLANSIIRGVTEIVEKHGKVIVLEDDIVSSHAFLKYMNDSLSYYENIEKVMHISGYFPPIQSQLPEFFFYNQTSCWGWGTWKSSWIHFISDPKDLYQKIIHTRRVNEFNIDNSYPFLSHLKANIDGKLKTWAIKWHSTVFLKNGLCLHPNISYVKNIGFDDSGENCGTSNVYDTQNLNETHFTPVKKYKENKKARKAVVRFNKSHAILVGTSLLKKIKALIKR